MDRPTTTHRAARLEDREHAADHIAAIVGRPIATPEQTFSRRATRDRFEAVHANNGSVAGQRDNPRVVVVSALEGGRASRYDEQLTPGCAGCDPRFRDVGERRAGAAGAANRVECRL